MKYFLVIAFLSGPMDGVTMQVSDPIDQFECDEMAAILNAYTINAEYYCEEEGAWYDPL